MENNIHNDIERVLFTSEQLMKRAEEIGKQITEDYKGEEVTIIGILKGSFMFLSDVMKSIDLYTRLDFVTVQSYGNGTTSGELRLTKDITADTTVTLTELGLNGDDADKISFMIWNSLGEMLPLCEVQ